MKLPIYLDNNATTPVDPRVLEAMLPYLREHFGKGSAGKVSENLPIGQCAIDSGSHRTQVCPPQIRIQRCAGQFTVRQADAVLRGGNRHPL